MFLADRLTGATKCTFNYTANPTGGTKFKAKGKRKKAKVRMSLLKLFVTVVVLQAAFFVGCSGHETAVTTGPIRTPEPTPLNVQKYRTGAYVRAIDRESGQVTVDHDDIPGYMAAMSMTEKVSDVAKLDGVAVGDRIELEITRDGSQLLFSELKRTIHTAEVFAENCATCHGAKGEGDTKGIPLTKGHALDHSLTEHIKQVTFGKKKMPAFHEKLTAAEIEAVVNFVRETLQSGKPRNTGHKH